MKEICAVEVEAVAGGIIGGGYAPGGIPLLATGSSGSTPRQEGVSQGLEQAGADGILDRMVQQGASYRFEDSLLGQAVQAISNLIDRAIENARENAAAGGNGQGFGLGSPGDGIVPGTPQAGA